MQTFEDLIEAFDLVPDWEGRYGLILDLGRGLPVLDESLKADSSKVEGCISQVWLICEESPQTGHLHFKADSDSHIVRGLIALLLLVVQDKTAAQIRALDVEGIFEKLGLSSHLSPNRRNGFQAMIRQIKQYALVRQE